MKCVTVKRTDDDTGAGIEGHMMTTCKLFITGFTSNNEQ